MDHPHRETGGNLAGEPPSDWLAEAWARLPERSREIITARHRGAKLREIGDSYGFTRERARQVLTKAANDICAHADRAQPQWREKLLALADIETAIARAILAEAIDVTDQIALESLVEAAGLHTPRVWGADLTGWWSTSPTTLATRLEQLTDRAPFSVQAMRSLATECCIPDSLPLETMLDSERSPLLLAGLGWLRKRVRSRDAAYMWLLEQGAPHRIERIVPAVGAVTAHALAEAMRRDGRFVQIRPEGTWALAEWPRDSGTDYRRAEDVVVDVVEQFGPITKTALFAKAIALYPVTRWRLEQCLYDAQLGETSDGLIDLVARGARHIEIAEPARPDNMASSDDGKVYGIRLTIDKDMARGSGVLVNQWLTWKLGLRRAPMSMSFDTDQLPGPLSVRRNTSGAQLSSLRAFVLEQGLALGCDIAIVLLTESRTARIRHVCEQGRCLVGPAST
ncbi:sigma factor-like helix-turn-helix DNA-binding protein [Nocardia testacea]|uniref:sigma factor-like helix-turn-helix DNA-binding protein n=1 Tax=Nocardia testacea TaxID=248551 RepID=UPI003A879C42